MPRFRKGTLDHDSDGRKGGSNPKEHDMAKAPKKTAAKKPAAKTEPTIKADGQNQMSTAAAEQAEATQDSAATVESGQTQGPSPREQRDKLNAEFEKADEKGKAAIIDETQTGLQVRGY